MTRDKYKIRLGKFLDFIGIEVEDGNGSLEDKARIFDKNSRSDFNAAFADILKFIQFQKDRALNSSAKWQTYQSRGRK